MWVHREAVACLDGRGFERRGRPWVPPWREARRELPLAPGRPDRIPVSCLAGTWHGMIVTTSGENTGGKRSRSCVRYLWRELDQCSGQAGNGGRGGDHRKAAALPHLLRQVRLGGAPGAG